MPEYALLYLIALFWFVGAVASFFSFWKDGVLFALVIAIFGPLPLLWMWLERR